MYTGRDRSLERTDYAARFACRARAHTRTHFAVQQMQRRLYRVFRRSAPHLRSTKEKHYNDNTRVCKFSQRAAA